MFKWLDRGLQDADNGTAAREKRITMSALKIYRTVRDRLVEWGWVSGPRFYMKSHPVGTVRSRLMGRGSRQRFRRVSLQRLLRS
jgi:hypothetical protein